MLHNFVIPNYETYYVTFNYSIGSFCLEISSTSIEFYILNFQKCIKSSYLICCLFFKESRKFSNINVY